MVCIVYFDAIGPYLGRLPAILETLQGFHGSLKHAQFYVAGAPDFSCKRMELGQFAPDRNFQ